MSPLRVRRLVAQDQATPGCADCGRTDIELEPDVPLCRPCRRAIEDLAIAQAFRRAWAAAETRREEQTHPL